MITDTIQKLFDNAKNIVFLTGAGASTASGIPDYRSKGGLYDNATRPEYLLSTTALINEPAKMYQFIMDNMYYPNAKPNIVHEQMAKLTKLNRAKIITQNVDGLHQKAGTPKAKLIEFHGNIYDLYTVKSHKSINYQTYMQSMYTEDNELIRPNITLYGEVPFKIEQAIEMVHAADLIVIVGTSFVVYPFAGLLDYAKAHIPIIAINKEYLETPYQITQVIGDATDFFTELRIN